MFHSMLYAPALPRVRLNNDSHDADNHPAPTLLRPAIGTTILSYFIRSHTGEQASRLTLTTFTARPHSRRCADDLTVRLAVAGLAVHLGRGGELANVLGEDVLQLEG